MSSLASAAASVVSLDSLEEIDLDLSNLISGNSLTIGGNTTNGLTGEQAVALAVGVAQAQQATANQFEAQERQERERRLLITTGTTTAIGLFFLIIYLIAKKN